MLAQFVHIGDIHLHGNARQVDRLRALDQIIDEGLVLPHLAAWLVPGDIFHQRSTVDDRNALKDRVKRMADRAPVVICYGNHDLPGDLDIFGDLKAAYPIIVIARPQVIRIDLASGQIATIFVLPYPTEAGLVSAGVGPSDIVRTAREALDLIFMDAAARLEEARSTMGDITLMIGHVNVAGSIVSTGQPNIGREIELDAALLARLGPCYKGLNHIHKAQEIGGAFYAGSICRLDWGEIEPKGYIEVTYGPHGWHGYAGDGPWDSAGAAWDYDIRRRALDVPPMYHVEGWLSRDGFTDVRVTAGPEGADMAKPESWAGCEVRARVRYLQSEKAILELAKPHVLAEFAEARRFELELVAVADRGVRAPEVAAAKTLSEKVSAWATTTKTVVPEHVLAKVPTLEHGDPDHVVATVQRQVEALLTPTTEESEVAVA